MLYDGARHRLATARYLLLPTYHNYLTRYCTMVAAVILRLLPLILLCPIHRHVDAAHSAFVNHFAGATRIQSRPKQNGVLTLHAKAGPRTGFAQQLLDVALTSPIWEYVLVPQARASIVKTAEENGIPWVAAKEWLMTQEDTPWNDPQTDNYCTIPYPEYYQKPFHAYSKGNLSYDAAFEQELAR